MAIDMELEQPQPISDIKDNPEKAEDDINRAIQTIMRNMELLRQKAQEE
jgi:hypothetical protein